MREFYWLNDTSSGCYECLFFASWNVEIFHLSSEIYSGDPEWLYKMLWESHTPCNFWYLSVLTKLVGQTTGTPTLPTSSVASTAWWLLTSNFVASESPGFWWAGVSPVSYGFPPIALTLPDWHFHWVTNKMSSAVSSFISVHCHMSRKMFVTMNRQLLYFLRNSPQVSWNISSFQKNKIKVKTW